MYNFEVAGGSVIGRDDVDKGQNSHDAYDFVHIGKGIVAVVCDGCGSGKHSEVGAKIAARIVSHELARMLSRNTINLHRLKITLISNMAVIANGMGYSMSDIIGDYFLYTVICAIIDSKNTRIIGFGDGAYVLNGHVNNIDYDNVPPYIAYNITGSSAFEKDPELADFRVLETIPTGFLGSLIIGSDGLYDLIRAAEKEMPGKKNKKVGNISQFWAEDKYFSNNFAISRKLRLINRTSSKIDWEKRRTDKQVGLLHDDTTFIVVRRNPRREFVLQADV